MAHGHRRRRDRWPGGYREALAPARGSGASARPTRPGAPGPAGLSEPRDEFAARGANAGDLAAIRALLASCDLPPEGIERCLTDCLLVEDRGEVVACAALERCDGDWLLRSLSVASAARRLGVASALVERLLERARSAGARRVWLLTETAEHWFEARGWRPTPREAAPAGVAEHAQFQRLCPASARLMCREL